MSAFLEVRANGEVEVVPLVGRVVIGRSRASDIVLLDDPTVSRTHAAVERYGSGWAVHDLGGSNGTFVNGIRLLSDQVLQPGDEVRVGDSRLIYGEEDPLDDTRGTIRAESREHITVLFTDMVGSTQLSSTLEPPAADHLRRDHFRLLREAIASSAGSEVKNLGDGVMAVFPGASAALSCAQRMQQMIEENNVAKGLSIGLRVGVSCGDASREQNDYFGNPVIEAARLCAVAKGGQVLMANAVRLAAGKSSSHEFRSLGDLDLKGLAEPVLTYELTRR